MWIKSRYSETAAPQRSRGPRIVLVAEDLGRNRNRSQKRLCGRCGLQRVHDSCRAVRGVLQHRVQAEDADCDLRAGHTDVSEWACPAWPQPRMLGMKHWDDSLLLPQDDLHARCKNIGHHIEPSDLCLELILQDVQPVVGSWSDLDWLVSPSICRPAKRGGFDCKLAAGSGEHFGGSLCEEGNHAVATSPVRLPLRRAVIRVRASLLNHRASCSQADTSSRTRARSWLSFRIPPG